MAKITIFITQNGKSGEFGKVYDGLILNEPVILTNVDNSNARTYKWEITSWPNSIFVPAPILNGDETSIASFTPMVVGTYVIRLIINGLIKGQTAATVKTEKLGLIMPSTGENGEYDIGWEGNINYNIDQIVERSIHTNISGEINQIEEKAAQSDTDILLIEDSEDNYKKKKIQIGNLPVFTEVDGSILELNRVIEELESVSNCYYQLEYVPYDASTDSGKIIQVFKDGILIWYDETLPDSNSWWFNSDNNCIIFLTNTGHKFTFFYWTDGTTFSGGILPIC